MFLNLYLFVNTHRNTRREYIECFRFYLIWYSSKVCLEFLSVFIILIRHVSCNVYHLNVLLKLSILLEVFNMLFMDTY